MYGTDFYETSRNGMMKSANVLVPRIMDRTNWPIDVIDVGCGEGWWALEFAKHNCHVVGIDGDWHGQHQLGDRFIPHNLSTPLPKNLHGRFNLVVCFEVAEHLPPARAKGFVKDLCALVKLEQDAHIFFSAAIPGQGGTGHVNEQWPDYWAGLFNQNGFSVDSTFRYLIWEDDRIENWYRQNLLVAYPARGVVDMTKPLRLVHPILYDARRER